jgi:hypothetical protein
LKFSSRERRSSSSELKSRHSAQAPPIDVLTAPNEPLQDATARHDCRISHSARKRSSPCSRIPKHPVIDRPASGWPRRSRSRFSPRRSQENEANGIHLSRVVVRETLGIAENAGPRVVAGSPSTGEPAAVCASDDCGADRYGFRTRIGSAANRWNLMGRRPSKDHRSGGLCIRVVLKALSDMPSPGTSSLLSREATCDN